MLDRKSLTKGEVMFVIYLVQHKMDPKEAYLKAFPTKNLGYASQKASQLIKTERVQTAMKEELKPVLKELGIDDKTILAGVNAIALSSEKDETRLKALFKLCDILDLEDKTRTNVQQITGVQFQGFTNTDLDALPERPEELTE